MVVCELMDPVLTSTTLFTIHWCMTAQFRQALLQEFEALSASSRGWLCGTSSPTRPPSTSSQSAFRYVCQEPCNRGSLKGTHHSMVFLESMAGVSFQERFTDSQLYNVLYQELLVAALPGSPAMQSPTAMLVALEHLVVCTQTPRHYRAFAWWLLIQNWATLRVSDHRGSVKIDETGFSAQLTRSKPWARTGQPPHDRSSSTAAAILLCPDGCKKFGECSKTC